MREIEKSFGKDFFLRFTLCIVCLIPHLFFHFISAYDEICVFVFIHFSRDLTFYYVCALRLEGEEKVSLLLRRHILLAVAVWVCNKRSSKPEDIYRNFRNSGWDFDAR